MRLLRCIAAGALALLIGSAAATAADRAIIILDGSGSMWAQIDGEARISIARETLADVLSEVPDDLELGLMSYGHREKGNCEDIELLVEPAAGTADAIDEAARGITPLGKTPISDAVRLAAEDLRFIEEKATVILITDGIETCNVDPCELASELEGQGIDFTTHVVGFGLSDEEGADVACLAENTGGTYFQANDGAALAEALTESVTNVGESTPVEPEEPEEPAAPEFNFDPSVQLSEDSDPMTDSEGAPAWEIFRAAADGSAGEHVTTEYNASYRGNLEPGDYVVRVGINDVRVEQPVTITEGEVAEPVFILDAGRLIIHPRKAEGEPIDSTAAVRTLGPGDIDTTYYGDTSIFIPAGDTEVSVSVGRGMVTETITVAAGETVERDMVIGVGRVTFNAFYVEGMRVEDGGVTFNVVGPKDIAGNRVDFGTSYGPDSAFELPGGDYFVLVRMSEAEAETPFTVTVGEATAVDTVLEAGVLAITAPGLDFIEVFGKADIAGNRPSFGYGYGGALQLTLPEGDYFVVAHAPNNGGTKEADTAVTAGKRTELTVE